MNSNFKPRLNDSEKIQIIELNAKNFSVKQIAIEVKRSKTTVRHWLKRWMDEKEIASKKRTGRKRKIDADKAAEIINLVRQKPTITAFEIKTDLNLDVNTRTITRILNENKLKSFKVFKKPLHEPKHLQARLCFANCLKEWTYEDWKNVIFTDEKTFYSTRIGKRRIYKMRGEKIPLDICSTTTGKKAHAINVWAGITWNKVLCIKKLPKPFTSEEYLNLLINIWPNVQSIPNFRWQQDGASIHRAHIVQNFLNDNQVLCLDWPSRSPDLNPVENFWGILVQRLDKEIDIKGEAKSEDELFERIERASNNVSTTILENLYESMPKRMQDVIKQNGGAIKK